MAAISLQARLFELLGASITASPARCMTIVTSQNMDGAAIVFCARIVLAKFYSRDGTTKLKSLLKYNMRSLVQVLSRMLAVVWGDRSIEILRKKLAFFKPKTTTPVTHPIISSARGVTLKAFDMGMDSGV